MTHSSHIKAFDCAESVVSNTNDFEFCFCFSVFCSKVEKELKTDDEEEIALTGHGVEIVWPRNTQEISSLTTT